VKSRVKFNRLIQLCSFVILMLFAASLIGCAQPAEVQDADQEQDENLEQSVESEMLTVGDEGFIGPPLVELFSSLDPESEKVGELAGGDSVTILDESEDWFLVETVDAVKGWVQKQAVVSKEELELRASQMREKEPGQVPEEMPEGVEQPGQAEEITEGVETSGEIPEGMDPSHEGVDSDRMEERPERTNTGEMPGERPEGMEPPGAGERPARNEQGRMPGEMPEGE